MPERTLAESTAPVPPSNATSRRELLGAGAGLAAGSALAGCAALDGAAADEEEARLDELLPGLADARGDVAPIGAEERRARRERLSSLMAQHELDALLVEPGATMSWLSGVEWGRSERLFGLVALASGGSFWVAPAFEEERARRKLRAAGVDDATVVPWQEHEHPYLPLAAELEARRATRLGIEPSVRFGFVARLAATLGRESLPCARELLVELRGRKDEHELALMRRANELTQEALQAVGRVAEPGMTDREVSALVRRAQEKLGLTSIWDLTLIGPDAALPHGSGSGATLERGSVLLIDTGGSYHGYQSDETRTWVVGGPPSEEVERVWHAVRDAQRAGFDALRPGARCKDADAAARASLDAAGYGPGYRTFTHRLGHGIGMEGHEDPYLDGGSEVVLAPGMTFSDEPGVYLPGRFGLRIEDIVVVTADGADHFGEWQAGPTAP